jgi:hypothetical protein
MSRWTGPWEASVPILSFRRNALAIIVVALGVVAHAADVSARPAKPAKPKPPAEEKAWIDGKGLCLFPFAADRLPDNSGDFAAAMELGYRKALKLPDDANIVVAEGGTYPNVDSLKIDVCDAVIPPDKKSRKPSERQVVTHALDAGKVELLGQRMSVDGATVNLDITATDAKLLFTRDKSGKALLMLGGAKAGRMRCEMTLDDVEQLLLAAARKGGRPYGLRVERTRLKMNVEDGRIVRVDLKLFTRFGFTPAGLRFRARLDIDDHLQGRLSELSCSGDDVLGPLISGLIQPFLAKYNGKTRPLMNFPKTDMRLQGVEIVADERVRLTADFGS